MNASIKSTSRISQAGPLLWLVLAIPAATIVAGITTLVVSLRTGSIDAVIDPVTRTAQVQDRELAADQQAVALGLAGNGRYQPDTGAIAVDLTGNGAALAAGTLQLAVLHPARGSLDHHVPLVAAGNGRWLGRVQIDASHDWNLQLGDTEGSWRLVGRITADEPAFQLRPALAQ